MKITGKYTEAFVFTEDIEGDAVSFVENLCNHPAMENIKIAQMPDVHAGNGCNVGTAYPLGDYVNPDHIGVDIGCTISMHKLSKPVSSDDFALLDHRIREAIPMGFEVNPKKVVTDKELFKFLNKEYNKARSAVPELIPDLGRIDERAVSLLLKRIKMEEGLFYKSLGTLGGGNHFIEYGEASETGDAWLTIHTGSRNLGLKVAKHHHNIASNSKAVKYDGFLSGDYLKNYLSDMIIAQAYAIYNHITIRDRIGDIFKKLDKIKIEDSIFTTHNYISVTDDVPMVRKGAIDASEGLRVCIPFNMRDGIAICEGLGNPDWNFTAPHGAGRRMSRSSAKKNIPLEEFQKSMNHIFSTSVCEATLDESPQAYKPTEQIKELIAPTVKIISMVVPRLNIKDIPQQ
ncbi:MAG: RtcB family protein [Odoribacter sp.]|nr:RtcB family protein [Odoribacter sp.]